MSIRARRFLFLFALALAAALYFSSSIAKAQESTGAEEHSLVHPNDEVSFPLLQVGGSFDGLSRQESAGGLLRADLDVDADWFLGGARASVGFLGNSPNGPLFTEFSGYAHLLAIGISDITYRQYSNGRDLRVFGGFSYTEHVEDVVRVDVNIGLAYFNESLHDTSLDQIGFQVGTRVLARAWQIRNMFYISAYQNVRFNDATVDLTGTEIICDTSGVLAGEDLVCTVPEREGAPSGGSILDWQAAGVILHNRTFLWVHRDGDVVWGPEVEFRLEILPLSGTNIWAMVGLRGQWEPAD